MFNVELGGIVVFLALIGLVLVGVYRLIGWTARREMDKREGGDAQPESRH